MNPDKRQFDGDGKTKRELYRSRVLNELLHNVKAIEHASPKVEKLLSEIVTKAVKANVGKQVWGAAPYFAAQALRALFEDYPSPQMAGNNELMDPEPFMR